MRRRRTTTTILIYTHTYTVCISCTYAVAFATVAAVAAVAAAAAVVAGWLWLWLQSWSSIRFYHFLSAGSRRRSYPQVSGCTALVSVPSADPVPSSPFEDSVGAMQTNPVLDGGILISAI